HALRNRPLPARRRVQWRSRDRLGMPRRRLPQREWREYRFPDWADRDGGADVLHRRRRLQRDAGELHPDGHTAGGHDDHHLAAFDHHYQHGATHDDQHHVHDDDHAAADHDDAAADDHDDVDHDDHHAAAHHHDVDAHAHHHAA